MQAVRTLARRSGVAPSLPSSCLTSSLLAWASFQDIPSSICVGRPRAARGMMGMMGMMKHTASDCRWTLGDGVGEKGGAPHQEVSSSMITFLLLMLTHVCK